MTTALDVAGDLDAALERLRRSLSRDAADEQRRAVREVLACAYELREHRKRAPYYQDTAEQCDDGLVTEAITALRGRLVHDFVNGFGPQSGPIYPQPDLYPSEDLWPGDNLVWRRPEDMGRPLTRKDMPRQKQAIFDAYTDQASPYCNHSSTSAASSSSRRSSDRCSSPASPAPTRRPGLRPTPPASQRTAHTLIARPCR